MASDDHESSWVQTVRLLRWPVCAALVAGLAWYTAHRLIRTGADVAQGSHRAAVQAIRELGEGFRSGTITETFIAAVPELLPEGMRLEVAALEATETIVRRNERRALFDLVPLGEAVTEIRVPVTYRYHLSFEHTWLLDVRDGVCHVRAPAIQPTLPPAIDTAGMEKRIDGSWLRFDEQQMMEELERSLTARLSARAGSPGRIEIVREICRKRVAEFVREWLLAEQQWGDDRIVAVEVVFADEQAILVPEPDSPPP